MPFYRYLMITLLCLSLTACGQDNPTLTADTAQNVTEQNPSADPADTEHDHAEHEEHDHAEHEDHDHAH